MAMVTTDDENNPDGAMTDSSQSSVPSTTTENEQLPSQQKEQQSPPPPPFWEKWMQAVRDEYGPERKRPPLQVDDFSLVLYDVFLILNLTVSISFWVVHRMELDWIAGAVSEGCLLSLCWMVAGLGKGAFLFSAVDGHQPSGGPMEAAKLATVTFLDTVNVRLLVALLWAVLQHRAVGIGPGESLLPLELGLGWMLMPLWRLLHSSYIPRL